MRIKFLIVTFLVFSPILQAETRITLPENNFYSGWTKAEDLEIYREGELHEYNDGAAEIFYEYGFERLLLQRYDSGEDQLDLEIYIMDSPLSALGIYLYQTGEGIPLASLDPTSAGDESTVTLLRGQYYIQINTYPFEYDLIEVTRVLTKRLMRDLPAASEAYEILEYLPRENIVPGSEMLIRGQYSTRDVYDFGNDDILLLKGEVFGVAGDYNNGGANLFTRIVVPYDTKARADYAMDNLRAELDSEFEIIEGNNSYFIFRDRKGEYGYARRDDNILKIAVRLPEYPDIK